MCALWNYFSAGDVFHRDFPSRGRVCCFHSGKHRYGWGIMFMHAGHYSFFSFLRVLLSRNDTPCCLDDENLFLINLSSPREERSFVCEGKNSCLSRQILINLDKCLIFLSSDTQPYRLSKTARCIFACCETIVSLGLVIDWDIFFPLFSSTTWKGAPRARMKEKRSK
jgi:hypothetical protein